MTNTNFSAQRIAATKEDINAYVARKHKELIGKTDELIESFAELHRREEASEFSQCQLVNKQWDLFRLHLLCNCS